LLFELRVCNFAIIEEVSISFQKGLTVLTGETGAGKSIIIDAIHLLVGGRGSSEFIRHGEEKAEIEGLFIVDDKQHPLYKKAQEVGIEIEEGMIVLRREMTKSGKSVCRVNGKLVTIAVLREIGSTLIDIHGQHEHQELMNESKHLSLLDQFGSEEIATSRAEYKRIYRLYEDTLTRLKGLSENEQKMAHRLDLIQFQLEEIKKADLKMNEDEELLEEKGKLSNFERIFASLQAAFSSLTGEQTGLDWVGMAMGHIENANELDPEYKDMFEAVSNSFYQLEDTVRNLRNKLDGLEYDPERINQIEERLTEINQLKRKYGKTIIEILEYAATIEEEIETIQNKETHIHQLENELAAVTKDLSLEAKQLSDLRKKSAKILVKLIHRELKELYMEKTVFDVQFKESADFQKNGKDMVEFFISTNPGEPLKPLAKIASGGEMSRIMLALKSIFSIHQGVTSIIFDEVDTGVSGRVAQAIGEKIYKISNNSQVLCISHLPQVAAMADTHLFIAKKTTKEGRTITSVTPLSVDEKIEEISRMISGVEITDLTKQHAEELLQLAHEMKP
jgi:DNA repair protein RecN (Recombination protein N)